MPNANVIGTDLMAPTQYQDGQFRIWNYNQIYLGLTGLGKFVPTVGDIAEQVEGRAISRYVVLSIHPTTLVSTLGPENKSAYVAPLSQDDIYFGVGPGTQADTYRVYCNKSVVPYTLTPDERLHTGGMQTVSCKVFRGSNTSQSGIVISALLNQNGAVVSENIPMVLTSTNNVTNYAEKVVATHHTSFDLNDGEVVTLVFYNNEGVQTSKRQCLIELSTFTRSLDASRTYVTSIALETPFMSTASSDTVVYPLNIPLNALNLIGVVNYSDGSMVKMPVDGVRFSVLGLQAYAPTIPNQRAPLVLKYLFGNNEYSIGTHVGNEKFTTANYTIIAGTIDGNYSVQLYCYPVWVDSVTGYQLSWFLYDLDRGISYNVTNDVIINTNYAVFLPKGYGQKQSLSVSINLKAVNGAYKSFYHVQVVDVQLNRQGNERPDVSLIPNWQVSSVAGQTPMYGAKAYATYNRVSSSNWQVNVSCGQITLAAWLAVVYTPTRPLFNPDIESSAPTPTHFKLIVGNNAVEYPVEQYAAMLTLSQTITNNATVYLEFYTRTVQTDLQTSKAGMPIYAVDNLGGFT